ncbi:MAG: DPP IV N-terminal domain-containing protein [Acidobacteriota bacterium]|nr:DPP IV N-terminal domain-containing protein [Acidobacteriota bacterium]
MRILFVCFSILLSSQLISAGQQITGQIVKNPGKPLVAVTDFRGSGAASDLMTTFNGTVRSDLESSPLINFIPKTLYPLQVPQQPRDLQAAVAPPSPGTTQVQANRLSDWSLPPIAANYLGIGYGAEDHGNFVVFGWFYSTAPNMPSLQQAQVFGKVYTAQLNQEGAVDAGHRYAADILSQFGGKSLVGTRIVFVSNRTGAKEIWVMNWDGSGERQLTRYGSISTFPSASPDGRIVAFTTYAAGYPAIQMFSLDTGRKLPFYNQRASMNAFVSFTPDSKRIVFSSTAAGGPSQLYSANKDGSGLHRITSSSSIEVEAKVNPVMGTDMVDVSGRSGFPQIYQMNLEGANVRRLSAGTGEATNPAWSPDGAHIAFAWTKGFEPGNYNIFVMDVASGQTTQLTANEGRNENPSWAPDGAHIVYASKRGSQSQIWEMNADGTGKHPLTKSGSNEKPVWVNAEQ